MIVGLILGIMGIGGTFGLLGLLVLEATREKSK